MVLVGNTKRHAIIVLPKMTCLPVYRVIVPPQSRWHREKPLRLQRFGYRHGHRHGGAHHGVVAHADKAHHFNVKVECVEVKCLKSLGFGAYRGSFNPIILWISTYINVLLYFDFIVDFS